MKQYGIGVIGCGNISETYLRNLTTKFKIIHVVGVSDIIPERSAAKAEKYGLRQMTNQQLFDDPAVDIIVNLTNPMAHYEVSKNALIAGKHVYSEKMMAVTMAEADELAALAREKNLYFTVAPDTFLGGGLQTCRHLIDSSMIGTPMMAQAFIARACTLLIEDPVNNKNTLSPGGGIPYDMGSYYITALIALLGGLTAVTGFSQLKTRKFLSVSNPRFGETVSLETPTNMAGSLQFASGALGTIAMTSENFGETRRLEIYGTDGILICPDPNNFGGPVQIIRKSSVDIDAYTIPPTHGYTEGCNRGLGVADLAWALETGRAPRLSIGHHAFEAICGIWDASDSGKVHVMRTQAERPAPIPAGYTEPLAMEAALAL